MIAEAAPNDMVYFTWFDARLGDGFFHICRGKVACFHLLKTTTEFGDRGSDRSQDNCIIVTKGHAVLFSGLWPRVMRPYFPGEHGFAVAVKGLYAILVVLGLHAHGLDDALVAKHVIKA